MFRALARVDRVTVDGKPVRVSGEPRLPTVVVEDAAVGFRVRLETPDSTETIDGVLRPEGEAPLSGRELHDLRRERIFGPNDVGELVGSVLPALAKRLALDVRTKRLPSSTRERPRMALRCGVTETISTCCPVSCTATRRWHESTASGSLLSGLSEVSCR